MPLRLLIVSILTSQFVCSALIAEEPANGKRVPAAAPVEARLIAKQVQYVLPAERHGKAFQQRITTETDTDNLPAPPRVKLVLELKNVSNQDVMIWPQGAITHPTLTVEGKGVVAPESLQSFGGSQSATSVQPVIKPGQTHRIEINSLNPAGGTPWFYWNQPGEYSITAKYVVHTGLPPFPFAGNKKPAGKPQRYEVTTPAVKVNVVLEKPLRPLVVAHRGLLRHAPENTLANFRACLELRMGFEFDVRKTNDEKLVCIHDSTVNRTTDGEGDISNMSLAQLRALDAGRWFSPRFSGEKVPTVEEVLQLIARYRQHDILIAVDLKADEAGQDIVRMADKLQVLDKLLFIGSTISTPAVRAELKSASPRARTAVVANNPNEFTAALSAADGDWVYFRFLPTRPQIEKVHRAGKRAFIAGATVSGQLPGNWRQAAVVGLDAVLTDYPLQMTSVLSEKAAGDGP